MPNAFSRKIQYESKNLPVIYILNRINRTIIYLPDICTHSGTLQLSRPLTKQSCYYHTVEKL